MNGRVASEIVERFQCSRCGSDAVKTRADGGIACSGGHQFPLVDGYIDARPASVDAVTSATFASFGFEWTRFSDTGPQDPAFWGEYFADIPQSALADAVAIDVGCGMARYSLLTSKRVRHLVAVDGSDAIASAVETLAGETNTTCLRADLRDLPFIEQSFDFVSCLGVLHHLTDPEDGFRRVANLVRPGGHLLVYVYSRPSRRGLRSVALGVASGVRRITVRIPRMILRPICWPVALILYAGFVVPGEVGHRRKVRALASLPLDAYRGKPLRSLWVDTFDRLSAPVEHRYVWGEVEPWFVEAGLEVVAVREFGGLMISAHRPS